MNDRTIDIASDVTPDKRARLEESRELAQSGAIIFGDDLSMHPGTGRLIRSKPTPMAAAPEPSGGNDWLELIRLREFVKGTSSTAPLVHFMLRAESAESRLAAARAISIDMVAQLQRAGFRPAGTRSLRTEGFLEACMRAFSDIAARLVE